MPPRERKAIVAALEEMARGHNAGGRLLSALKCRNLAAAVAAATHADPQSLLAAAPKLPPSVSGDEVWERIVRNYEAVRPEDER